MEKFTRLQGKAAPLPMLNVDTDMIIPKQFLKTIHRTGLGRHLFHELRFTPQGDEIEGFILNQEPFREACILVAGANFGCGSSREHAPWALTDFGVRCVIAPSFADIFYNNCFENALLPVRLPEDRVESLMEVARAAEDVTVDLPTQEIRTPQETVSFDIEPHRKRQLLEGLDTIALTLERCAAIEAFEQARTAPWL